MTSGQNNLEPNHFIRIWIFTLCAFLFTVKSDQKKHYLNGTSGLKRNSSIMNSFLLIVFIFLITYRRKISLWIIDRVIDSRDCFYSKFFFNAVFLGM